jgi:MFS family permease
MLAGVVAAFLGPEVGSRLHHATDVEFAGSFIGLSVLMLCAFSCILFFSGSKPEIVEHRESPRALLEIASSPMFLLAMGAAVVGYGVMSLIMTATPVSMHTMDHFSLEETKWVIQSHIVAMFLPSLFSGILISRFGAQRIIGAGLVLLFICLAIAFVDQQLLHYWFALVLLGVGWNFLFLGGTTLLTTTYRLNERFKVQALNDFLVFGCQAMAALGSGAILSQLGWHWVLGLSLPLLILLLPVMWFSRVKEAAA